MQPENRYLAVALEDFFDMGFPMVSVERRVEKTVLSSHQFLCSAYGRKEKKGIY